MVLLLMAIIEGSRAVVNLCKWQRHGKMKAESALITGREEEDIAEARRER
jgi:hypothetical protein